MQDPMSIYWPDHSIREKNRAYVAWLLNGLLFSAALWSTGSAWAECTAGNPNAQLPEDTPTSAFTDNGDGTVTHTLTGLTWDRCSLGQTWVAGSSTCDGTARNYDWGKALEAAVDSNGANHLGHTDWRLPNRKELTSITERCGFSPLINSVIFPATPSIYFWSASSDARSPDKAWTISFNDGNINNHPKTYSVAVRLVRGGSSYDAFDRVSTHQLSVNMTGNGSVQSSPAGIVCPGTCSAAFDDASTVDLTAGSGFIWIEVNQAWSNDCNTVVGDVCKVIMDADKSVGVTFNCEIMDIPEPVAPLDPKYECAVIKATSGFEIGPGSDVTFEAETSVELGADGPGAEFKVGNGGVLKVSMPQ